MCDKLPLGTQQLLEQADAIDDPAMRHSFLERVAVHRELLRGSDDAHAPGAVPAEQTAYGE